MPGTTKDRSESETFLLEHYGKSFINAAMNPGLAKDLARTSSRIDQAEKKKAAWSADKQTQLDELKKDLVKNKAKIRNLEEKQWTQADDDQLAADKVHRDEVESNIDNLAAENADLEKKRALKADITKHEKEIANQGKEIAEQQAKIDARQAEVTAAETQINTLTLEIAAAEAALPPKGTPDLAAANSKLAVKKTKLKNQRTAKQYAEDAKNKAEGTKKKAEGAQKIASDAKAKDEQDLKELEAKKLDSKTEEERTRFLRNRCRHFANDVVRVCDIKLSCPARFTYVLIELDNAAVSELESRFDKGAEWDGKLLLDT